MQRITLRTDIDVETARAEYATRGRVRIFSLIGEGAGELHEGLSARADWVRVLNTAVGVIEIDPGAARRMTRRRWAELEAQMHLRTRSTFQYCYHALAVPPAQAARADADVVGAVAEFVHGAELTGLVEAITGVDGLRFTDGQITGYRPGDFLTAHDDAVHGKARETAFVLQLTPFWRTEYGGLLLFHDANDRSVEGLVPRFNVLDLFRVPVTHSVSLVTPAAPHPRFAVTGWLAR